LWWQDFQVLLSFFNLPMVADTSPVLAMLFNFNAVFKTVKIHPNISPRFDNAHITVFQKKVGHPQGLIGNGCRLSDQHIKIAVVKRCIAGCNRRCINSEISFLLGYHICLCDKTTKDHSRKNSQPDR
tara:strand:+ start:134 stop:514 length:381 start_codon:yes stop_codon:yes gene_type:complete